MNDFFLSLLVAGALSTSGSMPFWSYANQFDVMPRTSGGTALLQTGMSYDESRTFQLHWGLSAGIRYDNFDSPAFLPDEGYFGFRWKKLDFDLGLKRPAMEFLGSSPSLGSISATGGNLIFTGNSHPMPGYCINVHPVDIPFTKGHLQIEGKFADYVMADKRVEDKALAHNTALGLVGNIGNFSIRVGIDHWAVWDGSSIGNYFRMLVGKSAGKDGSKSDRMNVIGNQLGSEKIGVSYKGRGWKAELRHDIPYDDKSGMIFRNFPDGINTLSFSFDDKDRWVSDIVYEFHYTMYQSGPIHDNELDEKGNPIPWRPGLNFTGGDNYFNNSGFPSGWTYFGMTVGTPLFFPSGTRDGTWCGNNVPTAGVENNRLKAHHLGLSGKFFKKIPYRLMATYSLCYGLYHAPYAGKSAWGQPWGTVKETPLHQFSAGFSCEIPLLDNRLDLIPGIYADSGEVLKKSFAATLGVKVNIL